MNHASRQSDYVALIDAAYAAAADRAKWSDFLSCVTERLGGQSTIYRWARCSPTDNFPIIDNFDQFGRSYEAHYRERNVWVTNAIGMNQSILPSEQTTPAAILERTEFYNDWLRPQGLKHGISCQLTDRNGLAYSLGIIRSPSLGEFERDERSLLAEVMPQVQRALELGSKLEALDMQMGGILDALSTIGIGALTCDSGGRIIIANAQAGRLLSSGAPLSVRAGRLGASPAAMDARLKRAVYAAAGGGRRPSGRTGALLGMSGLDGSPITISVTPLQECDRPGPRYEPLALLIFGSQSIAPIDSARLASIYGLTTAEASLAAALVDGDTLADHARRVGVSLPTVKTQLAAIFAKVGVNRQVDLVRVLGTNALLRRRPGATETDPHPFG